ncbi:MAG TPA: MarR family winged helix-turn-helix transcriptional regulator [Burkholderiales bacterium]|jgi:DNA-binding MarR family transcriptional regulator|nr:MarR family winged helix-turn-helix transcriptional regulator [Burkholderiales bacterium]
MARPVPPEDQSREKGVSTIGRAAADPSWRHTTAGRLLHNAARKFDARVLEILSERGWKDVRLVHINLTRCLEFSGTRLTELAKRAAMTKQAMGELVDECERIDLVARTADATDGRAKIVVFTARGKRFMAAFRDAIATAEEEMTVQFGPERLRELKEALAQYAGETREGASAEDVPREEAAPRARAR